MKSFKSYLDAKEKLGPEATKARDKVEIKRQKMNLDNLTKEYNKMSKDEGGGGMAKAHADMFANTKKAIKEDGAAAGGMSVGAVAGSGDSRLPTSQREPGVSKKHNPVLRGLARRKPPKA